MNSDDDVDRSAAQAALEASLRTDPEDVEEASRRHIPLYDLPKNWRESRRQITAAEAIAQMQASAGNMGTTPPVIPECWRNLPPGTKAELHITPIALPPED